MAKPTLYLWAPLTTCRNVGLLTSPDRHFLSGVCNIGSIITAIFGCCDMNLIGFGIQNYRSFGRGGFLLSPIEKINIFIGRNNSGKSNILSAIRLLNNFEENNLSVSGTDIHRNSDESALLTFVVRVRASGRLNKDIDVRLQFSMNNNTYVPSESLAQFHGG